MAELGIGVRVRTGWDLGDRITDIDIADPRLRRGTVTEGPYLPGDVLCDDIIADRRTWAVALDGDITPGDWMIPEQFLFPIDDDNDQTTRDEQELVEERV